MKKTDRFERMAEQACMDWVNGEQVEGWKSVSVKLLRKEHRWVERMVKTIEPDYESARGLRKIILRELKQRRK